MSDVIQIHFIHEADGLLHKQYVTHAPRVGDELRFNGEIYYKVTRLVWVYDEPNCPHERLNVGIIE